MLECFVLLRVFCCTQVAKTQSPLVCRTFSLKRVWRDVIAVFAAVPMATWHLRFCRKERHTTAAPTGSLWDACSLNSCEGKAVLWSGLAHEFFISRSLCVCVSFTCLMWRVKFKCQRFRSRRSVCRHHRAEERGRGGAETTKSLCGWGGHVFPLKGVCVCVSHTSKWKENGSEQV